MKRKQPDSDDDQRLVSTPKRQRTTATNGSVSGHADGDGPLEMTPSKRMKTTPRKPSASTPAALKESGLKTPTHKAKAKSLFSTPTKATAVSTPTRARNADRSAKKKSARLLLEQDEEEFWDSADRLAEEILEDERGAPETGAEDGEGIVQTVEATTDEVAESKTAATPKRRAGRPKGAKNKRSPTPEGELPPHERYFFQNRAGPARTSNNTLTKVNLLTHEEYFEKLADYADPCQKEKSFLLDLHCRSFPQWDFEFDQNFNICLYGYGSKRQLLDNFADWLYHRQSSAPPSIVVVNGHTPNMSIRSIFATIVTAVLGADIPSKMGFQPVEVLELLQSALKSRPSQKPITVLINSIDAPSLRRATNQALLARLAATPKIRLLATADTPNFLLMWDISLRDQFNFVFHDCTTFIPFDTEFDVVEEVHNLLGRKGRRIGGKDGVAFVLKSLPENAQNLYRLLLTEILCMMDEGNNSDDDMDGNGGREDRSHDETGIEFRMLYQKAAEEFIASSEMMFRTLLKEFHDHQMITSRMDTGGMEILGVPLSREEMEGVLEDLVLS
ncbi:origin recognition complex subunit 2 [Aspergillus clavatus NRRL 1]|uniref:Origin recognition complex subunit 2 n=1 Tax=Aspergillus clavatus (strain ATCC 1007 / CBS 513.65 / DSM 816 / NCTC 3887 / NRRL 1 / QM 1276 / 107) TaxID=344612 RepID=A1CAP5_ASPCL|nr:origin recognition complex subunit 2, putative [Aspergillus clavatus NRRL 1]EAW12813.1 origin recognition complex subunit 2, putative [Aspergillus clavatus NRRL 1]